VNSIGANPSFSRANNDAPTQGFLENSTLVFSGFTLPVGTNEMFQIRLTNIRVDPNKLAADTSITSTVVATFPVESQSRLVLGVIHSSLNVSAGSEPNFGGCQLVSGGMVTPLAADPCPFSASQAGNATHAAVTSVPHSFGPPRPRFRRWSH
jgi:hypothetical protein